MGGASGRRKGWRAALIPGAGLRPEYAAAAATAPRVDPAAGGMETGRGRDRDPKAWLGYAG